SPRRRRLAGDPRRSRHVRRSLSRVYGGAERWGGLVFAAAPGARPDARALGICQLCPARSGHGVNAGGDLLLAQLCVGQEPSGHVALFPDQARAQSFQIWAVAVAAGEPEYRCAVGLPLALSAAMRLESPIYDPAAAAEDLSRRRAK